MPRAALIRTLSVASTVCFAASPPADVRAEPPGVALAAAAEGLPQMNGRWAQRQVLTSVVDVPIVGEVVTATTTVVMLDIVQKGSALTMKQTVCDVRITGGSKRVRTIIPRPFVRAVSGATRHARVYERAGQVRFYMPRDWAVHGARLARPTRDALPEDEDDRRLRDPDRDGNPGLTVRVEGIIDGEVYVVQRSWSEMLGTVVGDRTFDGLIKWRSEQKVVDSTSIFLKNPPPNAPSKNPKDSYFHSTRIDAKTTCRDVLKRERALFAR
ncbi:MAG: hypothetical protein AAGI01_01550 [Myxococcota bacterium]